MTAFIQLIQLLTLRRRAHDIDYKPELAVIVLFAYIATTYFQVLASKLPVNPILFAVIQAIVQCLFYFLILKINRKETRFVQMTTAIFGVSAILQFIGLALLNSPFAILGIIASAWNVGLLIAILKDTLECRFANAVLLTIAYHFAIGLVLITVFPDFFQQVQNSMLPPATTQ